MTNEIRAAIAKRLVIIEDQVRAIIELIDEPGECEHPEKAREDLSTMGITRWRCRDCGFLYEQPNERTD